MRSNLQIVVGMLDLDNWSAGFTGFDDQRVDIRDDFITMPRVHDNVSLYIYNKQCLARTIWDDGHSLRVLQVDSRPYHLANCPLMTD